MTNRTHVFLVSGERSGSTLTTLLLGAHSRCIAVGEAWKVAQSRYHQQPCTCGIVPVTACRFWSAVGEMLEQRGAANPFLTPERFPVRHRNLGLFHRKRVEYAARALERVNNRTLARLILRGYRLDPAAARLSRNTLALLDAAIDVSGRDVVLESCKEPLRAFGAYGLRPDSVKLIHLVRDGRGVMTSYLGKGQHGSRPCVDSTEAAVRRWVRENTKILHIVDMLPRSACLRVRYEDLCAAPLDTLGEVCTFLGIPNEATMLDYRRDVSHVFSGNQMRFRPDSAIRIDDKWRAVCVGDVLSTFWGIGGQFNAALGYVNDEHPYPNAPLRASPAPELQE